MVKGYHAFIPTPYAVQVRLAFDVSDGIDFYNFINYKGPTIHPTEAQLAGLAQTCLAAANLYLPNIMHNNYRVKSAKAIDISQAGGIDITEVNLIPPVGLRTSGVGLPVSLCALVQLHTALGGRNYRGKIYSTGLDTVAVSGRNLTIIYRTFVQQAWQHFKLINIGGGFSYNLAVLSLSHDNAWRTEGVLTPVSSFSVLPRIATQRKRLLTNG